MSAHAKSLDAIIIGAGPAGIAMAYRLKHELNFHDFVVYEKLDGVGGTWRLNTYPGWYVEIPTICVFAVRCQELTRRSNS
jgi:cation diffusion facilitator CzcD-associated flavoprotein CzcO